MYVHFLFIVKAFILYQNSYFVLVLHMYLLIITCKIFKYEKSGHLIGSVYFLHGYGSIYALSVEVVASLAI